MLKAKMTSALIHDEYRQVIPLGGEPLMETDKLKNLSALLTVDGQSIEELRIRIQLPQPAFSHL